MVSRPTGEDVVTAFELTVQHPDYDTVQVALHGPLDLARAYDFDDAMRRIERDAPGRLMIDLRGVEYLDTTGLARLLAVRRRCRRSGRRLVLVRGPRLVQRIFSLAALDDQFEIVTDPTEELMPG
jgi:anti-sigma B factor antagonist